MASCSNCDSLLSACSLSTCSSVMWPSNRSIDTWQPSRKLLWMVVQSGMKPARRCRWATRTKSQGCSGEGAHVLKGESIMMPLECRTALRAVIAVEKRHGVPCYTLCRATLCHRQQHRQDPALWLGPLRDRTISLSNLSLRQKQSPYACNRGRHRAVRIDHPCR